MKKISLLTIALFFSLSVIHAQKGANYIKISAGPEVTISFFAKAYNTGIGVYATDYYNITKQSSILFSTGINSFKLKNGTDKAGMWLNRFGLRQFFSSPFYFQIDAGVGIGLKNFKGPSRFSFGFGPGYLFKSKNGNGFDIAARFNRGFNRSWIGLGAGYQFKL